VATQDFSESSDCRWIVHLPNNYSFTSNSRPETRQEIKTAGTPFPTREEIAGLAYVYWEERGKPLGSGEEDWFKAEWALLLRQRPGKAQVNTARRLRSALMELQLDASSNTAVGEGEAYVASP
jgi:hypothetical protein